MEGHQFGPDDLIKVIDRHGAAPSEEVVYMSVGDVTRLCSECHGLLKEDKLLDAYVVLCRLDHYCDPHDEATQMELTLHDFSSLRHRVHHLRSLLSLLRHSDPSWHVARSSPLVDTLWRPAPHPSPLISVLLRGVIDAPLQSVLCVLREGDLWPTWVPHVPQTQIYTENDAEKCSPFQLYCRALVCPPRPLAPRLCSLHAHGYDLLSHGAVAISVVEPPEHHVPPDASPPFPSHSVPIRVSNAGCLLIPNGQEKTHVWMACTADPALPVVPTALVNFATRQLAHLAFHRLREVSAQLPKQHEERMQQNVELYGEMRRRIDAFFQNELKA